MLCLILFVASLTQAAVAAHVKLSPPVEVAQIDLGKLGGTLVSQLAWSPDGNELYLQTQTEDKQGLPKDTYHHVMPAEGGSLKKVGAPPDWAGAYWTWKSGQTAPDDPAFKISVSQEKRVASATAIPMGGDLAKGGADTGAGGSGASAESVAAAANASMNALVTTMLLKGEVVGEWVNHRTIPGTTFGWGPAGYSPHRLRGEAVRSARDHGLDRRQAEGGWHEGRRRPGLVERRHAARVSRGPRAQQIRADHCVGDQVGPETLRGLS